MHNKRLLSFLVIFLMSVSLTYGQNWDKPYPGNEPGVLYYPDRFAVYFRYGWENKEPAERVIRGKVPKARYFSYNLYNDITKGSLAALADHQIKTDGQGNYTIHIVPENAKTSYPNQIRVPDSVRFASFILRYYVPEGDMYASVPLPSVYLSQNSSEVIAPPSFPVPGNDPRQASSIEQILRADPGRLSRKERGQLKSPETPASRKEELVCKIMTVPVFRHYSDPKAVHAYNFQADGNYPNKDNHYILMPVEKKNGQVLLVRFKPPTSGAGLGDTSKQVRYFSISQGDEFTRTSETLYDKQLRVARDGFIYVAVTPDTAALSELSGSMQINLMNWYHNKQMVLILRHMLPAETFSNSTDHVPLFNGKLNKAGQESIAFIGDYGLTGFYIKPSALKAATSPESVFNKNQSTQKR